MKLKIGNFQVRSVCLGEKDAYENGVLTLCKEKAITYLKDCDDHITDLDIVIANPGEDTRIVPAMGSLKLSRAAASPWWVNAGALLETV